MLSSLHPSCCWPLSTSFSPRSTIVPFIKQHFSPSCRRTPSPVQAGPCPIFESLTLLHFKPDTAEELISDIVDRVWSVQYLVPGPIVGAAGPLKSFQGSNTTDVAFSHAVLFRFGTHALQGSFQSSSTNQDMLTQTAGAVCDSIHTINYDATVSNELESIFRRGGEWETGVECILGLSINDNTNNNTNTNTNTSNNIDVDADADEFLVLTQQLATSSAFGAVQAVFGPCKAKLTHVGSEATLQQPDLIFTARFQQAEQLEEFLACPPVAAMIEGDERCPLKVVWHTVLEIYPADNNTQT